MNKGVKIAIVLVLLVAAGFYFKAKWAQLHPPMPAREGMPSLMGPAPAPGSDAAASPTPAQ